MVTVWLLLVNWGELSFTSWTSIVRSAMSDWDIPGAIRFSVATIVSSYDSVVSRSKDCVTVMTPVDELIAKTPGALSFSSL